MLNTLHIVLHLVIITTLCSRYYYYAYFTDECDKAKRATWAENEDDEADAFPSQKQKSGGDNQTDSIERK